MTTITNINLLVLYGKLEEESLDHFISLPKLTIKGSYSVLTLFIVLRVLRVFIKKKKLLKMIILFKYILLLFKGLFVTMVYCTFFLCNLCTTLMGLKCIKKLYKVNSVYSYSLSAFKVYFYFNSTNIIKLGVKSQNYEQCCYSMLKQKKTVRVMSRGPIARKKKSLIYLRLGSREIKVYNKDAAITNRLFNFYSSLGFNIKNKLVTYGELVL